jgi:hypothetical protein
MALTPAEKQRRYRERQSALMQSNPDVVERTLMQEVERADELSETEREALADKLVDLAMRHFWRAQELKKIADKLAPYRRQPPMARQA